jgi:uncharacterized protein YndB with AHSA1/START domain
MATSDETKLERELTLVRVFDAPRELMFKAWTDPQMMSRWFGPKIVARSDCRLDVRVGGNFSIVMRGSNGDSYPMKGVYQEVTAPERLVFTNIAIDDAGRHLLEGVTRVTFEDAGGKTKLTMYTHMFGKVPNAEFMLRGMEQGWSESLDKLGTLLAEG